MAILLAAGFSKVGVMPVSDDFEIRAFAFKGEPSDYVNELLGLPYQG
jgi:hypothetical protein